jgi:hypothetical protein
MNETPLFLEAGSDRRRPIGKILKPYKPPQLWAIGDLLNVTLGGSPGFGDSGNEEDGCDPGTPGNGCP